jgi:hypothetical protein
MYILGRILWVRNQSITNSLPIKINAWMDIGGDKPNWIYDTSSSFVRNLGVIHSPVEREQNRESSNELCQEVGRVCRLHTSRTNQIPDLLCLVCRKSCSPSTSLPQIFEHNFPSFSYPFSLHILRVLLIYVQFCFYGITLDSHLQNELHSHTSHARQKYSLRRCLCIIQAPSRERLWERIRIRREGIPLQHRYIVVAKLSVVKVYFTLHQTSAHFQHITQCREAMRTKHSSKRGTAFQVPTPCAVLPTGMRKGVNCLEGELLQTLAQAALRQRAQSFKRRSSDFYIHKKYDST